MSSRSLVVLLSSTLFGQHMATVPDVVSVQFINGGPTVIASGPHLMRSDDGGLSWGFSTGVGRFQENVGSVVLGNGCIIAASRGFGAAESCDAGQTWLNFSDGLQQFRFSPGLCLNDLGEAMLMGDKAYRLIGNKLPWQAYSLGGTNKGNQCLNTSTRLVVMMSDATFRQSTDHGVTYTALAAQQSSVPISFTKSPVTGNLWFGGEDGTTEFSTDNGATWTNIGPFANANNPDGCAGHNAHLGFNAAGEVIEGSSVGITICIYNPNTGFWRRSDALVGGGNISTIFNNLITILKAPTSNDVYIVGRMGVFRSLNNGTSWTNVTGNLNTQSQAWENAFIGADNHLYILASEGLMYRTTNAVTVSGVSLSYTALADFPIGGRMPNSRAILKSGTLYAVQEGVGVVKSSDSGKTWTTCAGNSSLTSTYQPSLAVHPITGDIYISFGNTQGTQNQPQGGGPWFSTDNCATFTRISTGLANSPFNIPEGTIAFTSAGDAYLAMFGKGTFKLPNGTSTWVQLAAPVGTDNNSTIPYVDAGGRIYIFTTAGNYTSTDNGATFSALRSLGDFPDQQSGIVEDGSNNLYFGGFGNGVYKSTDHGSTWTRIGLTGTNERICSLTLSNNVMLASLCDPNVTSIGAIYRSIDTGVTWTKILPAITAPPQNLEDFTSARNNNFGTPTAIYQAYTVEDPDTSCSIGTNTFSIASWNCLGATLGDKGFYWYNFSWGTNLYAWPSNNPSTPCTNATVNCGYIQAFLKGQPWDSGTNRLQMDIVSTDGVAKAGKGHEGVQFGTYIRIKSETDQNVQESPANMHWYHFLDGQYPAGTTVRVILNGHAQHRRTFSGGFNWPNNPGVAGSFMTTNYWDSMTEFYYDTQNNGTLSSFGWSGKHLSFSNLQTGNTPWQPDEYISGIQATYASNAYQISFQGVKNESASTVYELRYSTSPISLFGWSTGIQCQTGINNAGNDDPVYPSLYAACTIASTPDTLYFALRPTINIVSGTCPTNAQVVFLADPLYRDGDPIKLSNFCSASSGTTYYAKKSSIALGAAGNITAATYNIYTDSGLTTPASFTGTYTSGGTALSLSDFSGFSEISLAFVSNPPINSGGGGISDGAVQMKGSVIVQ